jgi:plasmid stabilization system protein ParE
MPYEISLSKDAERDLEEIYFYIAEHDSRGTADHVLERLVQATDALRTSPGRGCALTTRCPRRQKSSSGGLLGAESVPRNGVL